MAPVGKQGGKHLKLGQHPVNGRTVLIGPYVTYKPFVYVVKCAGGCGANMLVPLKVTHPDGRVTEGDPDQKMWCPPCGAKHFMGVDVGPGFGDTEYWRGQRDV